MATIDWPANLRPQTFNPGLRKAVLQFRSPFNGTAQVVDLLAERWVFSLQLPPRRVADGNPGQVEALMNRLAGGVDRVRCHHWYRPVPAGTARGSITLASGAARGDSSLAITGAAAHPNLLPNSGFEIDTNADGLADGWALYQSGATGSITPSLSAGVGSPLGQRFDIAGLGSTSTDRVGVSRQASVAAGQAYALAADFATNAPVIYVIEIDWATSGGTFISSTLNAGAHPGGTARLGVAGVAPANAALANLFAYFGQLSGGPGAAAVLFDNVQFEVAPSATSYAGLPTLKAGDMLGAGGQLFQVRDDVTLSDAGAGTVNLVNRVRATIASGSAVTWDRPTAEFIVPATFGAASYRPAILEGMPFDLEEIW